MCDGLTPNQKSQGEGLSQENILLVSGGKGREVQMGVVLERSDPIKDERTYKNWEIVNRFEDNAEAKIQNRQDAIGPDLGISPNRLSRPNTKRKRKSSHSPMEEPTEESPKQSSDPFCFEEDQFESEIELEIEDDVSFEALSTTFKDPKQVNAKTFNRMNTLNKAPKDLAELTQNKNPKPLIKTALQGKDIDFCISNRSDISLSIGQSNDSKSHLSNDSLSAVINMEPGELEKALERKISRSLKTNNRKVKAQKSKFPEQPSSSTIAWERPENTNDARLDLPLSKPSVFTQVPRSKASPLTRPKPPAFSFVHPNEAQSMLKKIRRIGNSSIQTLTDCQNRILGRLSLKAKRGKRASLQDESSYVLGVIEQALYRLKAQRVDLAGLESTA